MRLPSRPFGEIRLSEHFWAARCRLTKRSDALMPELRRAICWRFGLPAAPAS